MFKEATESDVLKMMRNDDKALDRSIRELDSLVRDLRKAKEMITRAAARYRKEKLKKKSLKQATEDGAFAELDDYPTRESIRDSFGYDMITENEMERLFYLWDLREEQKENKKSEIYQDAVTEMLSFATESIERKYQDQLEELAEIRDNAARAARQKAEEINRSRTGLINL